MKSRRNRQAAFALLMTLVLIMLAGVALAGLARRSLTTAIEVESASEALKRRWAVRSARATFMRRPERILNNAEQGDAGEPPRDGRPRSADGTTRYANDPIKRLTLPLTLSGLRFTIILTDEQAKLNVNTFLRGNTRGEAQSRLRSFLSETGDGIAHDTNLDLQPLPSADHRRAGDGDAGFDLTASADNRQAAAPLAPRSGDLPARLLSYDQLFERVTPTQLTGGSDTPGLAAHITCWGNGNINVRRASPEVIRKACDGVVSQRWIETILDARAHDPYATLQSMIAGNVRDANQRNQTDTHQPASSPGQNDEGIDRIHGDARRGNSRGDHDAKAERQQRVLTRLRQRLTDRSTCHGLWVIAHGTQRDWHTFMVRTTDQNGVGRSFRFSW